MKDSDNSLPVRRGNFFRRHTKGLIAATLIVFIMLAYGIPVLVGDGTGKFSGEKKKIAQGLLQYAYSIEDNMSRAVNSLYRFQYYIEDIQPMSPQTARQYCKLKPDDDGTGYYYANMSQVTLYGFRIDNDPVDAYWLCSVGRDTKN